ncbi:MAG: nascent polypeptide-associated complex protein [Candidatus Aenigmatarchaeota archaeon]
MFGNTNPKKMQEILKKMNMNVREVRAEEVIIRCKDKNIIISKPEIMIADMLGKEVYQITGEVSESSNMSEKDIALVMEKTGKDRETVVKKLEELNNDIVNAIIELKGKNK